MLDDRNFTAADFGHETSGKLPETTEIESLVEARTRERLQIDLDKTREFRNDQMKSFKRAAYVALAFSPLLGAFEAAARPVRVLTHGVRSLKAHFNGDSKTALKSGVRAGVATAITAGLGAAAFFTGTGVVGYVGLNVAMAVLTSAYISFKYEPDELKEENERLERAESALAKFEQTVAERHKPTLQ